MHRSLVLASVIGIAAIAGAHLAACSSSTTTSSTTGDDGGGGDGANGNDSTTGTDGGDDSSTGADGSSDDSATGTDGGGDDGATGTDGGGDDSATGTDGGGDDSATSTDGGDGGCITLTVMNAPVTTPWCKISVAGGTATTDATQTVCVPSGTSVALTATPESATFELATKTWHDTTGDTGSGDPGTVTGMTSATHVVVTSKKTCVWACCPFSSDGSGCPTADQCP